MRSFFIALIAILSFIYLLNPSFGIFEIVPDMIPGIGNIDEATATMLFLSSLAYFGTDLRKIFGGKEEKKEKENIKDAEIINDDTVL